MSSAKKGFSLLVVLGMTLLATLVGFGVYKLLSQSNSTSGAMLHQNSASAAAKAGLASVKSWFIYNADDVAALLTQYEGLRSAAKTSGLAKPAIQLDVQSSFIDNAMGQNFKAYLVDYNLDPTTNNITVKIRVDAEGQDGSQASITGIYKVLGIEPSVTTTTSDGIAFIEDAIHLSGGFGHLNSNTNIEGSLFVNGDLYSNGSTLATIDGDIIAVNGNINLNAPIKATGNLVFIPGSGKYIGNTQYDDVTVGGHAYIDGTFGSNVNTGDNMTVGGDLTLVQSLTKSGLWDIKGNAHFMDNVGMDAVQYTSINVGGDVRFDKDLGTCQNGGTSYIFKGNVEIAGDLAIRRNSPSVYLGDAMGDDATNPGDQDTIRLNTISETGTNYINTAVVYGTTVEKESPIAAWKTSLDPIINPANDLAALRATIATRTAAPIQGINIQSGYSHVWNTSNGLGVAGCSQSGIIAQLNCVYALWKNDNTKLQNGYLVVDFSSLSNGINLNDTELIGKFIFTNLVGTSLNLPKVVGSSRLLIQTTMSSTQPINVNDTCNCVIYNSSTGEPSLNMGTNGLLLGAYVGNGKIQPQGPNGINVKYDETVIKDISTSGAIIGRDGNVIDPGTTSVTTTSLEPLSPRLQLENMSEYYTAEALTSNISTPKKSIQFSPQAVRIVQGSGYTSVLDVMTAYNVKTYYSFGATPGECTPQLQGSGSFPDVLGVYEFTFKASCSDSYTKFYVLVDDNPTGDPAAVVVGFNEANVIDINESDVNNDLITQKELTIKLRNKTNVALTEDATIQFDFQYYPSGKSKDLAVGENFEVHSPITKIFTIPSGTTVTDGQEFKVLLDLKKDNQKNELYQAVEVELSVTGAKMQLDPTKYKITLNFVEDLYDTYTLNWSNYTATGGTVTAHANSGKCTQTAADRWECDKYSDVTIEANPESNYDFKWTNASICNNASSGTLTQSYCSTTIDGSASFGLEFPLKKMKLTLNATGDGDISVDGAVQSNLPTVMEVPYGTSVTLKALPGADALWGGWGFAGLTLTNPQALTQTFTLTSDATLTAQFLKKTFDCFSDQSAFNAVNYDNSGSWNLSSSAKAASSAVPLLRIMTNPPTIGTVKTVITSALSKTPPAGIVLHYESTSSFLFIGVQPGNAHANHVVFCEDKMPNSTLSNCQQAAAGFDIPTTFELSVTEENGGKYLVRIDGKVAARFSTVTVRVLGQIGIVDNNIANPSTFQSLTWTDALIGCGSTNGESPVLTACKLDGTDASSTSHTSPVVINTGSAAMTFDLSDADNETALYYTLRGTDGIQQLNQLVSAGSISRTLSFLKTGNYTLSLYGTDPKGNNSNSCVWFYQVNTGATVTAIPTITSFTVKKSGSAFESGALDASGTTLDFAIDASSTDASDQLTLTWSGAVPSKSELTTSNSGTSTNQKKYTSPGLYTVTVTATSKYGPSVSETRSFLFTGTAKSPVINSCSGTPSSTNGKKFTYSVSATDPAGLPLTYEWSGAFTSTEKDPVYSFNDEGSFTSYVVATNSSGAASSPCRVTVVALESSSTPLEKPICKITSPAPSKTEGSTPVFDPGTTITVSATSNLSGVSYHWTDAFSDVGSGSTVSRKFNGAGTYSTSVRVQDSSGLSEPCDPITFKISSTAPSISALTCSGNNGSYAPATLNCTSMATKGSTPIVSYDWKLTDNGGNSLDASSGMSSTYSHAVTAAGSYTATLTVTDANGETVTKTATVILANNSAPTTGTCSVPSTGYAGSAITASIGTGWSDADGIAKYVIVWGDASTNSEGAGTSYSHIYTAASSYTVKAKAVDNYGATSSEVNCGTIVVQAAANVCINPPGAISQNYKNICIKVPSSTKCVSCNTSRSDADCSNSWLGQSSTDFTNTYWWSEVNCSTFSGGSSSSAASSSSSNSGTATNVTISGSGQTLGPGTYTITSLGSCTSKIQAQCNSSSCSIVYNSTAVFTGSAWTFGEFSILPVGSEITVNGNLATIQCY